MTFQYGGQREKKNELPNDTAMVHTKPQTWPVPKIHFSWSLAGVAASRVSIQSHMVSYCSAIKGQNTDKRTDRTFTNFERNLAVMVIYLPVKFEFDRTKRFRVRVRKRKCGWTSDTSI